MKRGRQVTSLRLNNAPLSWKNSCSNNENPLHQLSPYIGKIKSIIAGDLIERYTKPGDLIVDPFCGSGTIPLEAVLRNRRIFCSDISPYAKILTLAKLNPPETVVDAMLAASKLIRKANQLPLPDLRIVPKWVRKYFHPKTLKEILNFAELCRIPGNEFFLACLLGILHHQRPGFLSYPSSHLVPYLRDKKYPISKFPEMYEYRDYQIRIFAKIIRCYSGKLIYTKNVEYNYFQSSITDLTFPKKFDAAITSPPYMNALDYGRDNRLRIWFIDPFFENRIDNRNTIENNSFNNIVTNLALKVEKGLKVNGYGIFIVGERIIGSNLHPSELVREIIHNNCKSLKLSEIYFDKIPDIRRSRKDCKGIKKELTLIYKKRE